MWWSYNWSMWGELFNSLLCGKVLEDFVVNDNIMRLSWCNKMGLSLKLQKSVILNEIFEFFISEACNRCVLYSQNTGLLMLLQFIFYFWNRFKFTNSEKNICHDSFLLQSPEDSWGEVTKSCHHCCDGISLSCPSGSNFSYIRPFLRLRRN